MAFLGEHLGTVTIERDTRPIELDVKSIDVQMDEEWIPYVQASVVCALGDGEIERVDPQARDVWAKVTAVRTFGRIDRISDITRRYRGLTLAAITTQFRGATLNAVSRSLYHDYSGSDASRVVDGRSWRLMLREVTIDRKAATVTMQLASGEARLTDWQHMSATPTRVPGAAMLDKINWVLNLAGFGSGVTYYPETTPTDAEIGDEAVRVPGSSALDFLTGLTRQHDLMLWCDEAGLWHLAKDRSLPNVRKLDSAGEGRTVTEETTTRSRDEGWVTAVMVVYTWEGVEHYDLYYPGAPNPERALILRYARPFPGPGLAENIFRMIRSRGRALDLMAVSAYAGISPGQFVEYASPRETLRGRLAAIRWKFPDDEMSIRLREVGVA
ncbi:hypothetical protein [Microbacterium sp. Leaf179]|uniref:hypothetical protein n=1 Tax=Microbacterium sp. Leaf179 TaxID=1736288 RepID=UPI00070163C4|nr:hypothetical protein [Microbacterium sp. Leaf179]KQR86826.1 hypothetical protein ASF96_10965 [Microbacterium sp. Leaf179]